MKKSCIVFGSTTGTTEEIAPRIGASLEIAPADIIEAYKLTSAFIVPYEILILGSSTWGSGVLQDDWYAGLDLLKNAITGRPSPYLVAEMQTLTEIHLRCDRNHV